MAFVLLTLCILIGVVVIAQTVAQMQMGIILPIGQMIGMVGSFVVLGLVAIFLLQRFITCLPAGRA